MNNTKAPDERTPEELAELIDTLISQGSGHINVAAEKNGSGIKVETVKSTDVCGVKGACCQPTENAVDDE